MTTRGNRDKRFADVDTEKITLARYAKGWSREDLANNAGLKDVGPVKRAETQGRVMPRHFRQIAKVLGHEPEYFLTSIRSEDPAQRGTKKRYTWDDFKGGAEKIATEAFRDFGADTVLTFPSTSLVFVGLVLGMLPPGDAIRAKVYTAIFEAGKVQKVPAGFERAAAGRYTMLVPKAAVRDPSRKLVVIDDYITSGGAMEAVRRLLQRKKYNPENYRFACCIRYDGLLERTDPDAKLPNFVGIEEYAHHRVFELPWERESINFEDALKQPPTLKQFGRSAGLPDKQPVE